MYKLFIAECRRFSWWALAFGIVHLGILLFARQLTDPFQQSSELYQLVGGGYALIGGLLGLFQVGSYARVNQWITLLHRPLAPWRILLAITGGSAFMLALAVMVPLAVLLLIQGISVSAIVDVRHIMLVVAAGMIATIGLFAGTYAALAPRRYSWLVLVPALLPFVSLAVGWRSLLLLAAVLAVLILLNITGFRPDRSEPPRRLAALGMTALTSALGAYVLIVVVGDLLFQLGWIATGTHPLNSTPPRGGVVEAVVGDGAGGLEAGLSKQRGMQADIWRQQIRMSEIFELPYTREWLPQRGELTNVAPIQFTDKRRGIKWTFSHDDMRFHGVNLTNASSAGSLGSKNGFSVPPLPAGEGWFIAGGDAYRFDDHGGQLKHIIKLPQGETITALPAVIADSLAVFSNKMLRLYDISVVNNDVESSKALLAAAPLPGPSGNLSRAYLVELLDGYLVSFTYARGAVDGPGQAWQQIVQLNENGQSRPIVRRILPPDFPAGLRYMPYWVSPVLQMVRTTAEDAGSGYRANAVRADIIVPLGVWFAAAVLALGAALAVCWLGRRRGNPRRQLLAWSLGTFLLGLPMAVAFIAIKPAPQD